MHPIARTHKNGDLQLNRPIQWSQRTCILLAVWNNNDSNQNNGSMKTRRGSPVDDRPSIDKLHLFVQKEKKKSYTWHVTRDMFGWVNILSKFQLPSSYRFWFMILWRYVRKRLTESINESMNDEAVCRTASATPGLSNTLIHWVNMMM